MSDAALAFRLHETFRAYIRAEQASTRSYLDYQRGDVTEAEVHRLQATERAACDAHIEAINAVAGVTV